MATLTTTQMCLGMEETFPSDGTVEDKLRFLIQYAILAPSIRNSQPWKFQVVDDAVHLTVDRSRARRTTDPELRELVISCGAALQHLCVAARKFGFLLDIEKLPEGKSNLLAIVRLDGEADPGETDTILFYAIHKWLNVPQPFRSKKKIPEELLNELGKMADSETTWLHLARKPASRDTLAGLIAEADEAQKQVEENRRKQLAAAVHSKRRKQDRGALFHLGVSGGAGHIADYFHSFLRRPSTASEVARKQRALADSEPILAVLGTFDNTMASWLESGQVLASVLLRGLSVGVRASFLNQSVEMPEFRDKLMASLNLTGHPQVVFRLGFPESIQNARSTTHGDVKEEYI